MAGCDLTFEPDSAKSADPVPYYAVQHMSPGGYWCDVLQFSDFQEAFDKLDDYAALSGQSHLYRVVRRWKQP